MMASREVGRDWRDAGGVEFGMRRVFFLSLRSFVRGDAVRVFAGLASGSAGPSGDGAAVPARGREQRGERGEVRGWVWA